MAALIAAPIGALFGLIGAAVMEFIKRRLSHIDALHELCDEFIGDLTDLGRAVDRGVRPTQVEQRSILKLRRKIFVNLERLFVRRTCWAEIRTALERVDLSIEIFDELALGEGSFTPPEHHAEEAARALDSALRTAAGTDRIWNFLRGR